MHIHARSIRYFDMIRRCGSIREAARHLHVASSAVNRQLLQLEDEIGSPLFERLSSGLRLTAAGEVFSRHVITVLQDEHRLSTELELLRGVRRGSVSVAAVEGLNADLMPAVLTQMHRCYPTIQIHVRTCGSQQAAQAVIQGDADVGIGFSVKRHDNLRQCTMGRFALGAIVPPKHPIAQLERVDFAQCAAFPLILPTPELSMHDLLQPLLAHHKRALQVLLETSSIELARVLPNAAWEFSSRAAWGWSASCAKAGWSMCRWTPPPRCTPNSVSMCVQDARCHRHSTPSTASRPMP